MSSNDPFIICDNLVRIYRIADHDVVALQGLDLIVRSGEMLGIVGVSGSGKSTLMNILGGLDSPSAGKLRVGGRDLHKLSYRGLVEYRLSTVGFVWQQNARNLVPYLRAVENVEVPLTLSGYDGPAKRKRALELLDMTGIVHRANHYIPQLSGGEAQRVAISVALANEPKLLLADEPTGEVDEASALAIYDTFRKLNTSLGLTILIVSHDPNLANHVDRVVAIRDGKITSEKVWKAVDAPEFKDSQAENPSAAEKYIYETTVLDSAGRLQVPKEYLEKFNIRGRVKLEPSEHGILIRSADQEGQTRSAEELVSEASSARKTSGLKKAVSDFLSRLH
jgi:putative ABC transport system ATP-binding protein